MKKTILLLSAALIISFNASAQEGSPSVKIFSNFTKDIKKNYKNYLINNFIETFSILDSKVNIIFSSSKNPFK